ncbi:MAG: type II toxin-antitoxin system VapC family toxin [Methanobacteriota archaeon]|nr:MAG: type II toxin-antitoxin system VapC family toxin [Euryarchaeota archaeon]
MIPWPGWNVFADREPADRIRFIRLRTSIIDVDVTVAEQAANLKVREGLHMLDAIIVTGAQARNSGLVTGGKHFRRIPNVAMLSD